MDKIHICRRSLLKAAGLGAVGAAVGGGLYSLDVFSEKSDMPAPAKWMYEKLLKANLPLVILI